MHVMVVEDDRDTREVVKLILELEGMGVTEAVGWLRSARSPARLREADPLLPCAIVLDIMMPRCSGPEFRRRQLDDPLIADVPVIVLSAIADQLRIDDLHAFANVSKPFDPDQLVRVVRGRARLSPKRDRRRLNGGMRTGAVCYDRAFQTGRRP